MNADPWPTPSQVLSRFMLDCFPDPVVVLDEHGVALAGNRAAQESRLFDVAGLFRLDRRPAGVAGFLQELRSRGHAELGLQRTPGGSRIGHFVLEGFAVESHFVVTIRDLSERRSLEDELSQLRRVESLGLLTARVVHDLNNLLVPMLSLSRELAGALGECPAGLIAHDLEAASARAAALVRELLTYARPRRAEIEVLELGAVVSAMRPLIDLVVDDDIELVMELDEAPLLVRGDRSWLEQTILNLVSNARHAMPQGGRITIRTGAPDEDQSGPGSVVLSVEDNGVGMTEDVRARAFDDFFTTREAGEGTGLGLGSVQRYARELGGRVQLDSKVGRGTKVSVILPRASSEGRSAFTSGWR